MPHTYIRSTPSGCRGTSTSSRPVSVEYIRTPGVIALVLSTFRSGQRHVVVAPEEGHRHRQDALGSAHGPQAVGGGGFERDLRHAAAQAVGQRLAHLVAVAR